jgi:hypothetical protein
MKFLKTYFELIYENDNFHINSIKQFQVEPTKESIASAIELGDTRVYLPNSDSPYGGSPSKGFDCEGFVATGLPISFPEK